MRGVRCGSGIERVVCAAVYRDLGAGCWVAMDYPGRDRENPNDCVAYYPRTESLAPPSRGPADVEAIRGLLMKINTLGIAALKVVLYYRHDEIHEEMMMIISITLHDY